MIGFETEEQAQEEANELTKVLGVPCSAQFMYGQWCVFIDTGEEEE